MNNEYAERARARARSRKRFDRSARSSRSVIGVYFIFTRNVPSRLKALARESRDAGRADSLDANVPDVRNVGGLGETRFGVPRETDAPASGDTAVRSPVNRPDGTTASRGRTPPPRTLAPFREMSFARGEISPRSFRAQSGGAPRTRPLADAVLCERGRREGRRGGGKGRVYSYCIRIISGSLI